MDSLDTVEVVMACEEVFGTEIPDFENQSELVGRLEAILSNRRPNIDAVALLRKIAKDRQQPELAEGLGGPWRREQIAAVVRELWRNFD